MNDINIFSVVPIEVIQDQRLTKNQLKVLIALLSYRGKNTNLVYPSREKLSERCGIRPTTISLITTELSELGWLKKTGKGGFSKATRYTLTVPKLSTVPKTRTVPKTSTRKGVPKTSTRKELTNETKSIYKGIDLVSFNDEDKKLAKELIDYRKEIKSQINTIRGVKGLINQIKKCAKTNKQSIEFVVEYMMENEWQSIKPEWIKIEDNQTSYFINAI